jgi:hypothetical protein
VKTRKERESHPLLLSFPAERSVSEEIIGRMPRKHEEKVLNWRNAMFKAMGFDEVMAALLAHSSVDTHKMRGLLADGCPHETAVRILLGTNFQGDDPDWLDEHVVFDDDE